MTGSTRVSSRWGPARSVWHVTPSFSVLRGVVLRIFFGLNLCGSGNHETGTQFLNYKLVYRRYAGLFFTIGVDLNDNELACLETIHLFVELLDQYFSNVCELDIVFNFNKVRRPCIVPMMSKPSRNHCLQVYQILDEYMLAGEIQETSKREILDRIREMEKREKGELAPDILPPPGCVYVCVCGGGGDCVIV